MIRSESMHPTSMTGVSPSGAQSVTMIRPKGSNRPPLPEEVPPEYAEDYLEACLIIADSPKASAALSRRCLQHLLREQARAQNPNNLAEAIKEVINDPKTPTGIGESLDAVRNIGNYAAHPNKGMNTGEIVDVEPGEAEWCLEVIEMLYDYYFVAPTAIQRRTHALNERLAEMGKPPMTTPNVLD